MKNRANEIVGGGMPVDIRSRILTIRGVQVMLDRDLAELYDVPTGALNQAVKRNAKRFPERFVFQLSEKEFANWKSQIVISNSERMGLRKRPYAFTEHGITMLAALLKSERAIGISVCIVDALRKVERIIEGAKRDLVVVDPYSDAVTLDVLAKKCPGVTVRLVCKNRGQPTPTEIAKFNRQYKGLAVSYSDDFHDRFILVDGAELHNLGSSINCLGRRVTTYATRDRKEVSKFLALLSPIPVM